MSRPISADQREALQQGESYALFYEFDHPSGYVRCFTGVGMARTNDAKQWLGVLGILEIQTPQTTETGTEEITVQLTGIPTDYELDLTQQIRGRRAEVHYGLLRNKQVIGDLIPLRKYIMQQSSVQLDGDTYTFSMTGTATIMQAIAPTRRLWSAEYQNESYPNDTGFSYVELMQQSRSIWAQGELRT